MELTQREMTAELPADTDGSTAILPPDRFTDPKFCGFRALTIHQIYTRT